MKTNKSQMPMGMHCGSMGTWELHPMGVGLSRFDFYCDEISQTKQLGQEGLHSAYTPVSQAITDGNQSVNLSWKLQAGMGTRATEEHCSLIFSPGLAQLPFLYNPGPPLHGWLFLQLARPSCINHQKRKRPTDMPMIQSDRGDPSNEVISSQMTRLVLN